MNPLRIIFNLMAISVLSIFFVTPIYASCTLLKPTVITRLERLLKRAIIYSEFTPTNRILSYFQSTATVPKTYEEGIQETHALTLSVAELNKMNRISSSMYDRFLDVFSQHESHLQEFESQHPECQSEVNQLLEITEKNSQVAQELLMNRLPHYQIPRADNQ